MGITAAEVSANALRHNLQMIRLAAPGRAVTAMVKANAYGHGMINCAKVLRKENVEYLGVAFIDEAVKLRLAGDKGNILVLVSALPEEVSKFIEYEIEPAFSSFEALEAFAKSAGAAGKSVKGHLFIDTGMHRDGIQPHQALEFMQKAEDVKSIDIIGICTHLSTADSEDRTFAEKQISIFIDTVTKLQNVGFEFKYIHANNSAGIVNHLSDIFTMVRPGISLYGYMAEKVLADKINLMPSMTLKTKVIITKPVYKGETVGYSLRYIAENDTNVAIIPVGYGDGYFRNLTNRAHCLIKGKRYNLIGTVCMDQCIADIGYDDINAGDEVVLIGAQGTESILPYELADLISSIPYEITTAITERVPKVIVD